MENIKTKKHNELTNLIIGAVVVIFFLYNLAYAIGKFTYYFTH